MGTDQTNEDRGQLQSSAVFLLGMHRSGTSVIARALSEAGLWMGDAQRLLKAHPVDNPTGYWERQDVHDLHVRYLEQTGHDWNRLGGFRVTPAMVAGAESFRAELNPILAGLNRHRPWLVKDPRLSVLLPLWFSEVADAVPVVAVRHPLEIAASLRDTPRGVFATQVLLLLWQKYLVRMIADLNGRPAIYVSYTALLEDPVGQMGRLLDLLAGAGVTGLVRPSPERLHALIRRDLHRQRMLDDSALTADQLALYRWLRSAADQPTAMQAPPDGWHEPDRELKEFDDSAQFYESRGQLGAERKLEPQLAAVRQERTRALDQVAELGEERELWISANRRLDNDLKIVSAGLKATQVHVVNIEHMLSEERAHSQRLEAAVSAMRGSLSWRFSAPLRWLLGLVSIRLPAGSERGLHRAFYLIPGISAKRKRALIVWLHENMPWLTRHTVSYRLYVQGQQSSDIQAVSRWLTPYGDREREVLLAGLPRQVLVSVVMPVYNTAPEFLREAIDSVRRQSYANWQLCICDDASTRPETLELLREIDDPRIKVTVSPGNCGIAGASNLALAAADGELVGLLDHDDVLAPDALLASVDAILNQEADFVYSDEDKIDYQGDHIHPHFKPDFSEDYLLANNYLCHFSVMKREILERIGGFREGFDGAQDFDLFLRYLECSRKVVHLPRVLYHWRMHEDSTAASSDAKPRSWEAGRKAVADALVRRNVAASVQMGPYPNTYRIRYELTSPAPLVSIIIPFKDKCQLLSKCLASIKDLSGYDNYELLLVNNRSVRKSTFDFLARISGSDPRIRVLDYDAPFNYSAINNWAVSQSNGSLLLFLNNDTEAISEGWLLRMVEHAQRPDVGVVGAMLLYADATVQHAGVIVGMGGVAGHAHLFERGDMPGYFTRLQLVQEFSAVTFACAMTRRDVFDAVGGLNDRDLKIAFNDVDFCLRARELGYKVIYTPEARLYHYESKSRGLEDTPEKQERFSREVAYMQKRYARLLSDGDPFYNPNFTLQQPTFTIRTDAG